MPTSLTPRALTLNSFTQTWQAVLVVVCAAMISLSPQRVFSHEVIPTILDFKVEDGVLWISMQGSLEAFIAQVDLSETSDVNSTTQAQAYDTFRQLDSRGLSHEFASYWPEFADLFWVYVGETPLKLELKDVTVPEDVPFDLVRTSAFTVIAPLPEDATSVRFEFAEMLGDFVVRQNEVDQPFTGYIKGGDMLPPIDLQRPSLWKKFILLLVSD